MSLERRTDPDGIGDLLAHILAPRAGLPVAEIIEEWLERLRGQIAVLVPIVEDYQPDGWKKAVTEVRAELDKGPGTHLAASTVHAQRLAAMTDRLLDLATEPGGKR
ncbi:DUF6415 family natural product biosynthesis protein [Streptomyces sp. NPDC048696]|uniref:DUF6415 family natural product biosynthesis protein n=1 Tax=Streptomyces sp. NPDC048696 TaxID=3365585 RepID=UPI0037206C1D